MVTISSMYLVTALAGSGLVLSLLFPIGLSSTTSPLFTTVFVLHLLFHSYTVIVSSKNILVTLRESLAGKMVGIGAVLPVLLFLFFTSQLPITNRDALIHHLAVPKWWLENGVIQDIWWHQWSSYPMLTQLSYAGFLSWGIPELCTLYHASFIILLAGLIASTDFSSELKSIGILFSCTLPLIIRIGTAPYVDLPLAVYGLAFFIGHNQQQSITKTQALSLGILIGLSAAVKYNGLLFAIIGGLAFSIIHFRQLLPFTVGAVICGFPWYFKNWLTLKNPIYPLLPSLFPMKETLVHIPRESNLAQHAAEPLSAPFDFFSLPFQMLSFGQDNDPASFDGILSPFLLLFLIPSLRNSKRSRWIGIAICLIYMYCTLVLSGPRNRYFMPIIGITILLSIGGFERAFSWCSKKLQMTFVAVIILIQSAGTFFYLSTLTNELTLVPYLRSEITTKEYTNRRVSESLLADVVNKNLPPHSKIYLLYTGNRYYFYDRAVINSGYFSERLLLTWLFQSNSPEELAKLFHNESITHIAFHRRRYEEAFKRFAKLQFIDQENLLRWNMFTATYLTPSFEIGPYQVWNFHLTPKNEAETPQRNIENASSGESAISN